MKFLLFIGDCEATNDASSFEDKLKVAGFSDVPLSFVHVTPQPFYKVQSDKTEYTIPKCPMVSLPKIPLTDILGPCHVDAQDSSDTYDPMNNKHV